MLNEGKIMLMTKVAIYEKHEGNDKLVMARYFREDYIKYGCLKTVVATTIVYWAYVAVYILLHFEDILNQLTDMDYFEVIAIYLKGYVAACIVMFVYSFVIYFLKFQLAKPGIIKYNSLLRKLLKFYEIEQREEDKYKKRIKIYDGIGGAEEELPLDSVTMKQENPLDESKGR